MREAAQTFISSSLYCPLVKNKGLRPQPSRSLEKQENHLIKPTCFMASKDFKKYQIGRNKLRELGMKLDRRFIPNLDSPQGIGLVPGKILQHFWLREHSRLAKGCFFPRVLLALSSSQKSARVILVLETVQMHLKTLTGQRVLPLGAHEKPKSTL